MRRPAGTRRLKPRLVAPSPRNSGPGDIGGRRFLSGCEGGAGSGCGAGASGVWCRTPARRVGGVLRRAGGGRISPGIGGGAMTITERWGRARRWLPEATLAILAGAVFLGFLGAVDVWGKREQRAAAEALDTVDHGHWLVAQIQGRKRLEKPPLPRWATAALMTLTGRRDEAIVRLPAALSALGMVALAYGLGRRLGGRPVGLAAGLILTSTGFFVAELRQAGNDGPLAFFATLALYAAWRRLHGGGENPPGFVGRGRPDFSRAGESVIEGSGPTEIGPTGIASGPHDRPLGPRAWSILMYAALGLGFLTKGPVILLIAAIAVVPYLVAAGRLGAGLRALADGWGFLLFLGLALSWPVPVLIRDPAAARVWSLEMAQKAGTAGIRHARAHDILALEWPGMTAPWTLLMACAAVLPFLPRGRGLRPGIWFPWGWAVGNLAMFCAWDVAKPNYYLPCLPGAALLGGLEWVRLCRAARAPGRGSLGARLVLQLHWVALFTAGAVAPVIVADGAPEYRTWAAVAGAALAAGAVAGAWAWRRGADAGSLAPMAGGLAAVALVGYGAVGPAAVAPQGHRALAGALGRILPAEARTVMFYRDLDEGLWFYLRGRALRPVPGSQPAYNPGFDLAEDLRGGTFLHDPAARRARETRLLLDWLGRPDRGSDYVLIRARTFDQLAADPRCAADLARLATPIYREADLRRAEVVLLHAERPGPVASGPATPRR